MKKFYKTLVFFGFLFNYLSVLGQNSEKLISGNFENIGIEQFVRTLESKSGYHFYYNPSHFDSLTISFKINEKPLDAILDQAFNNTDFHYALDKERNAVFLTKKYVINTILPEGLTEITGISTMTAKKSELKVYNFSDNPGKEIPKATMENKLYEIGAKTANLKPENASLSGNILNARTGEPLIGVAIYIENHRIGVSTDQFGYYLLTLPRGRHILNISGVGIKSTKRQIMLYSNGKLNIELQEQVNTLKEVVVTAEKTANVSRAQMGLEKISIQTIKQVPTIFGEADILRVVLTLPGVKSVGEASTGFNVRGGATDQNLILFNDATIYNPSHFFGFFSAFNPEVVKDVELYKSSIPGKFGGRLSSVLDVHGRDENKKKLAGSAGIGLITTRLNIEGPIIKDKTSFILGGRTSYSNWLLKILPDDSEYNDAKAAFYDFNLHLNHEINKKNNLYFTGYMSGDNSSLGSDTTYSYNNKNASLKWKHVFSNKFYGVFSTGVDRYGNKNYSDANPVNAYNLNFDITQTNLKAGFNYYLNPKNVLEFGFNSIYYKLHPGVLNPVGDRSLVQPSIVSAEQALEGAVYLSNHYDVSPELSLDIGLRYSLFNYLGPKEIYTYPQNIPKEVDNILDTVN